MNHTDAVKLAACEKYLMGDLAPALRDEFEEHYFECIDCAQDVRLGAHFLAASRQVLALEHAQQPASSPAPAPRPAIWLGWLRPALAASALALFATVVYQNAVTIPHWKHEATSATILAPVVLHNGMARGSANPVPVPTGQSLAVYLDIPTQPSYPSYEIRLENSAGKIRRLGSLTAAEIQNPPLVSMPSDLQPGTDYKIHVLGVPGSGSPTEVGNFSFLIEIPGNIEQH